MRGSHVIGFLAIVLLLVLPAVMQADDQPRMTPPEQQYPQGAQDAAKETHPGNLCRVTDVIGMEVQGQNRNNLGKIENLAIDHETGAIRYVVVSFKTTENETKLLPVPWQALKMISAAKTGESGERGKTGPCCMLKVERDLLARAPSFEKGQWPNFSDQRWMTAIEQFYRPYMAKHPEGTLR